MSDLRKKRPLVEAQYELHGNYAVEATFTGAWSTCTRFCSSKTAGDKVAFSVKKLETLPPDFNPILHEMAPTSTAGIDNALKLADALGLSFKPQSASYPYFTGWGNQGANPKKVIYHWTLTVNDINPIPTEFSYDIRPGSSPIILGFDQKSIQTRSTTTSPQSLRYTDQLTENQKCFTYTCNLTKVQMNDWD